MGLQGTALVFMLIGCVYSQNMQFGRLGEDADSRLAQLGQNLKDQQNKLSSDLNRQLGQLDKDFDFSNPNSRFGQGFDNEVRVTGRRPDSDFSEFAQLPSAILPRIVQSLQGKCQEAGHPEVMDSFERTMSQTGECITKKINLTNIEGAFAEAARVGDLPNFFRKYCKVWPDVHGCINPLVSSVEKCLTSEENQAVDKTIALIDDSNTFFCENNANRITKFLENQGFQCFDTVKIELQGCTQEAMKSRQKKQSMMVTYDDHDCSDFHTFRRCVVNKLGKCSSRVPSEITDDFMGLIAQRGCNSASSLAWCSFVNIILVLATYLYSKMF